MIDNDYPLGFKVALHRKDLGIALELADQLGASLPVAALAAALETGLIAQGHGDEDMSALARAIRRALGPGELAVRSRADALSRARPAASGRRASRRSAAGTAPRCTSSATSTLRGPRAGSGRSVCAYLPSWIATIRPVTPSATRSIATFAKVVATIESIESGSPLRRS